MSGVNAWMPIYARDYLRKTQHLNAEEHGAYFLLMMHCWHNGGKIENCKKMIKNVCKIPPKKFQRIEHFFYEKDGYLRHARVEEKLQKKGLCV